MIEAKDLKKYYKGGSYFCRREIVKAVDGVSLKIGEQKTFGLLGESGCGKTTLGYLLIGLIHPDEGSVTFFGKDVFTCKDIRVKMQIIFQDPSTSLNPRATVGATLMEAVSKNKNIKKNERKEYISWLLNVVGLKNKDADTLPHELSGGQRQRVVIARALAPAPSFIVCDEPTSSLDASVQAQILELLLSIQEKLNVSYLFISHDVSITSYMSEEVAVMYRGRIVECAQTEELLKHPLHPYTKALLKRIPLIQEKSVLRGCVFSSLCEKRKDICLEEAPPLQKVGSAHEVACYGV